ncbi:helix-turn-helix domain-containing protein [Actinoallomurus soli]|uniref:helix-turn-helix domain-containing protein n=1 Tax=Actinoallomurus soli TaxID=2952535 RepID=UPI00209331EC|nr:helix-turn-helix transcriptional regulator [Actinoallomurus soli]MCO5968163.1 helix-turn-helix domain-containing protein [Actinoallomurus soli]
MERETEAVPSDPQRPTPEDCTVGTRLATELRALRTRTGKSLKELEQLIHASDSSISRYLSGRIVPPWQVIERLSRLAGDDPARLRPLWEHLNDDRHRKGTCSALPLVPPAREQPSRPPVEETVPASSGRRFTAPRRLLVGGLTTVAALALFGAGVLVGLWLAPDRTRPPVVQQSTACGDWPWPNGAEGQVVVPPAAAYGHDHTATVELRSGSVNGRQMAWGQISHARYGDRVWMDWSRNDGRTWIQCGPFTTTGATFSSRAHEIAPGWHFRACADTPRPAADHPRDACTNYW